MEQTIAPKEVRILETAEDIQERRDQVLNRYGQFKSDARAKRDKLEDSRRFQYFKRDADELEGWIMEKLQAASDESYKDPTNLQVCSRHFRWRTVIVFLFWLGLSPDAATVILIQLVAMTHK